MNDRIINRNNYPPFTPIKADTGVYLSEQYPEIAETLGGFRPLPIYEPALTDVRVLEALRRVAALPEPMPVVYPKSVVDAAHAEGIELGQEGRDYVTRQRLPSWELAAYERLDDPYGYGGVNPPLMFDPWRTSQAHDFMWADQNGVHYPDAPLAPRTVDEHIAMREQEKASQLGPEASWATIETRLREDFAALNPSWIIPLDVVERIQKQVEASPISLKPGAVNGSIGIYLPNVDPDFWSDEPDTLPTQAEGGERKAYPLATGLLDYFPDALAEVANASLVATGQHHAGSEMHWDRDKSKDEANTLLRHFVQRGTKDTDGVRHSAKVAWRALALLQKEIEAAAGSDISPASRASTRDEPLMPTGAPYSQSEYFKHGR